jgi:hypothetical protein
MLNQVIKKHNMSWDSDKDGWVNAATGDGVFVDKEVMEMILEDTSPDQPMMMYIKSENQVFIKEFEAHCTTLGSQFIREEVQMIVESTPRQENSLIKESKATKDVFVRLNYRDASGANTQFLQDEVYADLRDISGRWERRKKQLLIEYTNMGLSKDVIVAQMHREEIAFRKNNASWVTGEFPN